MLLTTTALLCSISWVVSDSACLVVNSFFSIQSNSFNYAFIVRPFRYYAPPPIGGGIKRCFCLLSVCLTSVCLSRTSGVNGEQRGLGRLKLAQR